MTREAIRTQLARSLRTSTAIWAMLSAETRQRTGEPIAFEPGLTKSGNAKAGATAPMNSIGTKLRERLTAKTHSAVPDEPNVERDS
ncbi:hypothetical protein ASD99_24410 [Mesorhizobium sp. Root695]|nr:hypothetical protein ASD99_24410 [Mesorhizobium sp. Root695]